MPSQLWCAACLRVRLLSLCHVQQRAGARSCRFRCRVPPPRRSRRPPWRLRCRSAGASSRVRPLKSVVGLRPPRVHAGAYHPRAPRQPAPCVRQAGHPSRVPVIHGLSAGVVCGVLASSAAARLPPPRRVISRTANASAWGGWYDDRAQKRTSGNVS